MLTNEFAFPRIGYYPDEYWLSLYGSRIVRWGELSPDTNDFYTNALKIINRRNIIWDGTIKSSHSV